MAGPLSKVCLNLQHLIHNFMGPQVAGKAALAGGAERAAHWAADLRADADRQARLAGFVGRDAHRLHHAAVAQAQQQLGCAVLRRRDGVHGGATQRDAASLQACPPGRRQRRHIIQRQRRVALAVQRVIQLLASKRWLPVSDCERDQLALAHAQQRERLRLARRSGGAKRRGAAGFAVQSSRLNLRGRKK